jgi:hypothetical protein
MEAQTTLTLTASLAAVLGAGSVLACRPWQDNANPKLASLPAIGAAVAMVGAMFTLVGSDLSVFWPKAGFQWLFWISLVCIAIAIIEAWLGLKKIVLLLIGVVVIVAGLLLIAQGRFNGRETGWAGADGIGWIGLSAIIAFANILASMFVSSKVNTRPVLIGWTLAIGISAGIVGLLGKSERLANLMLVLASGAGGMMLVTIFWSRFRPGASVWLTLSALTIGIVSAAMEPWYASLPVPQAIVVLAAPLACLGALLGERNSAWKPSLVVIIAVLALLAWPIADSYQTYQQYRALGFAP